MGLTLTDLSCLALSTGTGAYFIQKSKYSFKMKTMNVYTYFMHSFLAIGLIGKSPISLCVLNM